MGHVQPHAQILRPQRKVRKWFLTGVLVPLFSALLGAGSSIMVVVIQNSSPPAPPSSKCEQYERYVIQPMAEKDPLLAQRLMDSGAAINRYCGLRP